MTVAIIVWKWKKHLRWIFLFKMEWCSFCFLNEILHCEFLKARNQCLWRRISNCSYYIQNEKPHITRCGSAELVWLHDSVTVLMHCLSMSGLTVLDGNNVFMKQYCCKVVRVRRTGFEEKPRHQGKKLRGHILPCMTAILSGSTAIVLTYPEQSQLYGATKQKLAV